MNLEYHGELKIRATPSCISTCAQKEKCPIVAWSVTQQQCHHCQVPSGGGSQAMLSSSEDVWALSDEQRPLLMQA